MGSMSATPTRAVRAALRITALAALAAAWLFCLSCAALKKKEAVSPAVKPVVSSEQKPSAPEQTTPQTSATDSASLPKKPDSVRLSPEEMGKLSDANKLLLQAIDNYIAVLPSHTKTPEIMMLKGHTFYNNRLYNRAREVYQTVLNSYGNASVEAPEAIKMTAQTFYEENKYDEAQDWYKKLQDVAVSGTDKEEAAVRLAESHYKLAERLRAGGKIDMAISEYEKVAVEYPNAKIADAALFNVAGLYEEKKEWSKAILTYNKLLGSYSASTFLENAFFKTGRCYEQMGNWAKAAMTYVEIFQRFPKSGNLKDALFNAGLAYERGENYPLAAKSFEKYATLWPDEQDAPDVLFRAGELYGKLEDWENVEKINSLFGKRYGQDKERVVMAICMTGVASYMQKKYDRALEEFANAITVGRKIGAEGKTNAFYMAKAQFTIGQINQEMGDKITLILPETEYRNRLNRRVKYLENAVSAYAAVSEYKLLDWTTKAIYRIGETYEQFGVAVHRRERPKSADYNKTIELEEGIAQVVEQYFADKALPTHEQNVKFGIQYKYTDEWTERSRQQLTKLPFLAGSTYSKLISALDVQEAPGKKGADNPLLLIKNKLEKLQNIAPFQDKAIALYLKTLEMGVKYGVDDKYRFAASGEITKMSYQVGNTYGEVVSIARSAPIPGNYDAYKRFFYKVHLLGEGLVEYENSALEALYKAIKIAEAYEIKDEWMQKSREKISEILFKRAMCYEVLAEEALRAPPIPSEASEEETEEYRTQFEELSLKLQEEAQGIYRDIHEKGRQNITQGEYLDLAYLRLYANVPDEVGEKVDRDTFVVLTTGKDWRFSLNPGTDWQAPEYADSAWERVKKGSKPDSVKLLGASGSLTPVWGGRVENGAFIPAGEVWLRLEFNARGTPEKSSMEFAATGDYEIFINGRSVKGDSAEKADLWNRCRRKEGLDSYLVKGRNVLAVHVSGPGAPGAYGFFMNFFYSDKVAEVRPRLPSKNAVMSLNDLKALDLKFPVIPNFECDPGLFKL